MAVRAVLAWAVCRIFTLGSSHNLLRKKWHISVTLLFCISCPLRCWRIYNSKIEMRKLFFLLFLSLLSISMVAQKSNSSSPKVQILGLDCSNYTRHFGTTERPQSFLETMIGDTIVFEGAIPRTDFFKTDTVWIDTKARKKVEGKHFFVKKHYKSAALDLATPSENIYNRPWIIVSCFQGSHYPNSLVLRDVQTGDIVNWQYQSDLSYSQNVTITNLTKSHIISKHLNRLSIYEQLGSSFNQVKIVDAIMTISIDVLFYVNTYIRLDDNKTYCLGSFSEKQYNNVKTLYTENEKATVLTSLKNSGHYSMSLSKVQKPQNSQIKNGKIEIASDGSTTKYSYTDNYISVIWDVEVSEFSFILENKSSNNLKIEWDEASYIGIDNSASRVLHSGVRYVDKDMSMSPTIVPIGSYVKDIIVPANLVSYYGGDWHTSPMITNNKIYDSKKIGKTIKLLLPISIKGVINEYIFVFKIEWAWDYPELRTE